MSYAVGYSGELQLLRPIDLMHSLTRCAEAGTVVFAFLFLFTFVAGLV